MNADLVGRLFRTGLQVVGALVVGKYMDESTWATLSGALLTVVTTGYTVYAAKKAA